MAVIRIDLHKQKRALHPPVRASHSSPAPPSHKQHYATGKKPTYAKIFRWQAPAGSDLKVETVEIVGSFTGWKKVPLLHDRVSDYWQLSVPDIQSNRTHHYMILANGHPVSDKNCDGLAIPDGPQEAQYQMPTPRGPRVLMLFAQTK